MTVFGQGLIQAKCWQRLDLLNYGGHQGTPLSTAKSDLFSTMSPLASHWKYRVDKNSISLLGATG